MNHGIIIHPEDFSDLLSMSAEEAGHIIQNVIKTFNDQTQDTVPFSDRYLTRVSNDMCGRVVRDKELSERQRNRALGNKNATKTPDEHHKNATKTPNKRPNTKTNTNTNINKKTYGECANVYLTDEEHFKIVNDGLTGLIDELSFYIASKGDKYKSHYAVIKQWAMRRKREQAEKEKPKSNQFTQGVMSRDIDFTDLEKKLIKN